MTPVVRPPPGLETRPTRRDVADAAARLHGLIRRTPLVPSSGFDGWLKLESLQHTGAYKVRGALNALLQQAARGDRRPVVAASAGNHAAGVAYAARLVGVEVITVVPATAPQAKITRTRSLGARVIEHGPHFEAAYAEARRLARLNGWRFLHAFDDPDIIAGQGTIAFELLHHQPDVVLVPIGGGGLAAGMGLVLAAYGVRLVGVQVAGVDAMARTLRGDTTPFYPAETIADGVRVRTSGALTTQICREVLDDIITVTEAEVRAAMLRLAVDDRIVAEGAGALAAAGLHHVPGQRKIAVVSGGNVDLDALLRLRPEGGPESTGAPTPPQRSSASNASPDVRSAPWGGGASA